MTMSARRCTYHHGHIPGPPTGPPGNACRHAKAENLLHHVLLNPVLGENLEDEHRGPGQAFDESSAWMSSSVRAHSHPPARRPPHFFPQGKVRETLQTLHPQHQAMSMKLWKPVLGENLEDFPPPSPPPTTTWHWIVDDLLGKVLLEQGRRQYGWHFHKLFRHLRMTQIPVHHTLLDAVLRS